MNIKKKLSAAVIVSMLASIMPAGVSMAADADTDTYFIDGPRTVDYSKSWHENHGNATKDNTDADAYKFTVGNESFSLLDVNPADSNSKYFVIANQIYGTHPIAATERLNVFECAPWQNETGSGLLEGTNADWIDNDLALEYPTFWLNSMHFHDGYQLKNDDKSVPQIADDIRAYIDADHVWTCEAAPNITTPIAQYTFKAGIALPSANEISTYTDRMDSFKQDGSTNFVTRTNINYVWPGNPSLRYLGVAKYWDPTQWCPQQADMNGADFNIRPCFWLKDGFFANVAVDLATAGDAVKQEIKKVGYTALSKIYSEEDLDTYLMPRVTVTVRTRSGNTAAYGETLIAECQVREDVDPNTLEYTWKRIDGETVTTVGSGSRYIVTEADADTGESQLICEVNLPDSSGAEAEPTATPAATETAAPAATPAATETAAPTATPAATETAAPAATPAPTAPPASSNVYKSAALVIPSLGVAPVEANRHIRMKQEADPAVKFSVDGKSFTLIDSFDNDESTFFVAANDSYGVHRVYYAKIDDNTDPSKNYIHWLNNDFKNNGNKEVAVSGGTTVVGDAKKLPDGIINYINTNHIWLTEAAPNNYTPINSNYTFTAGIAPLSASEMERYKDVLGFESNIGNTYFTRTATNFLYPIKDEDGNDDGFAPCLSCARWYNDNMVVELNHWALESTTYLRPAFYLKGDFFANVAVDLKTAGSEVKKEIKKVDYDTLVGLYDKYDVAKYLGIPCEVETVNIGAFTSDAGAEDKEPATAFTTTITATRDVDVSAMSWEITSNGKTKTFKTEQAKIPALYLEKGSMVNIVGLIIRKLQDPEATALAVIY